ncbi:MAG TPA: metallopeptidase TldD-related protein [Candidatus Sulfopaludibacter sp.]|jgi:hypothetical protein|nr:metallopeptidase TldD-related protein [Candidatus Sulfopaludibacter sp.]
MKRSLLASAILGVAVLSGQAPPKDAVLQAMHDEVERSRSLSISNLEKPYFIEYGMDEAETFTVSASLGGVLAKRRDHFRSPEVEVRVGDYKFDNTNYAGRFGGGSQYDLSRFPLENAYPVLRRYFWLETDSAYKSAVEAISRKRAALKNLTQSEQLNDFAHAEPLHAVHDFRRLTIDDTAWTNRIRSLSAVFAQYPEVKGSGVDLEASEGGYYLVNSEGTEVKQPESVVVVRVRAAAQAPDGMTVRDAVTFHSFDAAHLPSEVEMERGVKAVADNVTALAHASKGEDYTGPVLFEGMAGAQVFAEVLGKNLTMARRPVVDGGRGGGNAGGSELEGRMGSRILPDSFTVVDDPSQTEWHGKPLFGHYEVDREGVAAKPLSLVDKGVLKNFLLTRQPVRGFEGSNGRARLPGGYGASNATFSNLFVSSTDTIPAGQMKKKLIELIQSRNKPYAILVRRMDFPSTGSLDEVRRLLSANQGNSRPISSPILIYKVFADGHEEMVRGMRFRGFNVKSLRDILATGDDSAAFEFMDSSVPLALVGYSSFTTEACVIAPSILIDDLELHPAEDELPKLPVVPAPPTAK